MSEKILKALMQLFAIIARPESNTQDRREVVESFLKRQLNQEMTKEYLKVFDGYYSIHQEKQKEEDKRKRRIAASSVRVLKICTEINEELTTRQKIIVLFQLFEFAKSDGDGESITHQELEFIQTVAETFNIPDEDFENLHTFILYPLDNLPDTPNLLIIDNNRVFDHDNVKHLQIDTIQGQIRILNISVTSIYLVRYIGESELYMNSQLIHPEKVYVFTTGSSIRDPKSKPIYYGDVISKFVEELQESKILFRASEIAYRFKGGKVGLHSMSFEAESGKLIGIMGASGAGKSTLLHVLNGTNPPSRGEVLLNGVNIHTEKDRIEGLIGFVSQDDLLIEELSVYQNLYYNAKLCFDNYNENEIQEVVDKVLQNLGLFEIHDVMVGTPLNKKISGGQRKRLNIALELIREPAVLFLDEPTSGLSSRDSENIMDLLKELTLKGKLVFVVIHQPSSDIFKMFDKLLILDTGGYLIYDGDPIESIVYFKSRIHHANRYVSECHECGNVNPEQVFNIVEANVLDEYGKVTSSRKISPNEWNGYFRNFGEVPKTEMEGSLEIPRISFKIPNMLKQFLVFAKRDILSKLANTQYLVITLLEAPLLAFLLSVLIKYFNVSRTRDVGYTLLDNENLPVYLFMSVIVAIFMGLTVSAEEIIKDRKILKRESFLNLSWGSYLMSKVWVQFGISAIQAATYVIIGNSIMEIRGMYIEFWIVLFSAWASSNLIGLVISDSFKTVVTIYILIPFLVIPQIILSGVMVKYEKLNPNLSSPKNIPWYGEMITARWGYEALATYTYVNNRYERNSFENDRMRLMADFKKDFWATEMDNALSNVERKYNDPSRRREVETELKLLRNEIAKETGRNRQIVFPYLDQLEYEKITPNFIAETRDYINKIRLYNRKVSNIGYNERDRITRELTDTYGNEGLLELKRKYRNEKLADFVTNTNESDAIIVYRDELIQKRNPIYLLPEHPFVKSHFYAPRKMVLGNYFETIWINTIVIWIMSLIFYIILHLRLLKRLLDSFEEMNIIGLRKKE